MWSYFQTLGNRKHRTVVLGGKRWSEHCEYMCSVPQSTIQTEVLMGNSKQVRVTQWIEEIEFAASEVARICGNGRAMQNKRKHNLHRNPLKSLAKYYDFPRGKKQLLEGYELQNFPNSCPSSQARISRLVHISTLYKQSPEYLLKIMTVSRNFRRLSL